MFAMRKLTGHDLLIKDSSISTQTTHNNISHNHTHDFYEFFYVIQGSVVHRLEEKPELLGIGDLRFIIPGVYHSVSRNEQAVQRDVLVDKTFFEQVCQFLFLSESTVNNIFFGKCVQLTIEEITDLERLLTNFSQEINIQKKRCIALEIVANLLSKFCETETKKFLPNTTYPDVIKTILTSFTKPEHLGKTINETVKRLGYSPIYISRLFKKHVGITLSEYLKDIRLSHTAYYLENTNYSLQQICNLVGLDNLSYLNKIFKEKYGTTPIKYRKMANKEAVNPHKNQNHILHSPEESLKDSKNDQNASHEE